VGIPRGGGSRKKQIIVNNKNCKNEQKNKYQKKHFGVNYKKS